MDTYEALQCGLPIITTYHTGSIIRDGLDGKIVPIRDSDAIARAILDLYSNGISHSSLKETLEYQEKVQLKALNDFRGALHSVSE